MSCLLDNEIDEEKIVSSVVLKTIQKRCLLMTIFFGALVVLGIVYLLFSAIFLFFGKGVERSIQSRLWAKNRNVFSPLGLSKGQLFVWRVVLISRWGIGVFAAFAMIIEITSFWRG